MSDVQVGVTVITMKVGDQLGYKVIRPGEDGEMQDVTADYEVAEAQIGGRKGFVVLPKEAPVCAS